MFVLHCSTGKDNSPTVLQARVFLSYTVIQARMFPVLHCSTGKDVLALQAKIYLSNIEQKVRVFLSRNV